jgi:hypothetical protein
VHFAYFNDFTAANALCISLNKNDYEIVEKRNKTGKQTVI